MRMGETHYGAKVLTGPEAAALRVEVSRRMTSRSNDRLERRVLRLAHCPDRMSVAKAMLAVERRLVEALWTLARLPNDRGIGFAAKNGVAYLDDPADLYANAVAAGGWLTTAPKPAPPSARSIDTMHEPLEWLRHLDRAKAKLLSEGAMSRRGDMENPIRWSKIRKSLGLEATMTIRTLQRHYEQALRDLVAIGVRP